MVQFGVKLLVTAAPAPAARQIRYVSLRCDVGHVYCVQETLPYVP